MYPVRAEKFVAGEFRDGRLFLTRSGGSSVRCGVVIVQGALTDNSDSTYDVSFNCS